MNVNYKKDSGAIVFNFISIWNAHAAINILLITGISSFLWNERTPKLILDALKSHACFKIWLVISLGCP